MLFTSHNAENARFSNPHQASLQIEDEARGAQQVRHRGARRGGEAEDHEQRRGPGEEAPARGRCSGAHQARRAQQLAARPAVPAGPAAEASRRGAQPADRRGVAEGSRHGAWRRAPHPAGWGARRRVVAELGVGLGTPAARRRG